MPLPRTDWSDFEAGDRVIVVFECPWTGMLGTVVGITPTNQLIVEADDQTRPGLTSIANGRLGWNWGERASLKHIDGAPPTQRSAVFAKTIVQGGDKLEAAVYDFFTKPKAGHCACNIPRMQCRYHGPED